MEYERFRAYTNQIQELIDQEKPAAKKASGRTEAKMATRMTMTMDQPSRGVVVYRTTV